MRFYAAIARSDNDNDPDPTLSPRANNTIPNPFAPLMLSTYISGQGERERFKRRFRRNIVEMFLWMALGSMALKTKWQRMETEEITSAARIKTRALREEIEFIERGATVSVPSRPPVVSSTPIVPPKPLPPPVDTAAIAEKVVISETGLVDKEAKKTIGTLM